MWNPQRNRNRSKGLTLIELVVVLTILTALGGLLVPIIGGMINRTHFAKCAVTIPDLTRQITRSFTSDLRYPNTWDSLMDAASPGSLFPKLPGGGDAGGELVAGTITGDQADAFIALGITEVVDLDATIDGDATWDVSNTANIRALNPVGDNDVATLNTSGISVDSLNLKRHLSDPTTIYVVFGLGNPCSAVGPSGLFTESPTHFGGEDVMNPRDVYQRYVVIFSVNDNNDVRFETAASVHPDGLDGGEAHVRGFYEETAP